jgi:hypothetical protein
MVTILAQTIVARIADYDISNIHLGGKIIFIPQEKRESTKAEHPTGKIVKLISENGILKDIDQARGDDLDKFLKEEEARRSGQSTTAAEKIRKGILKKEKPIWIDKSPEVQSPESHTLEMPLNSGVSVNPAIINDSYRGPPVSRELQCGLSGPCIGARCRKFASCWIEEIEALKKIDSMHEAEELQKEFLKLLGE